IRRHLSPNVSDREIADIKSARICRNSRFWIVLFQPSTVTDHCEGNAAEGALRVEFQHAGIGCSDTPVKATDDVDVCADHPPVGSSRGYRSKRVSVFRCGTEPSSCFRTEFGGRATRFTYVTTNIDLLDLTIQPRAYASGLTTLSL